MEPQDRQQLLDRLLEEATASIALLKSAITDHWVTREGPQPADSRALQIQEFYLLQAKRAAWEKAHAALSEARSALGQLERLEPRRVLAKAAGA
jgi:hypothetical protein